MAFKDRIKSKFTFSDTGKRCVVRPNLCTRYTQWGQRNGNIRVWSRKRFIAGPSKENWWLLLKSPELELWHLSGKSFKVNSWGERVRLSSDWLFACWWGNRNPGYPPLPRGGILVPAEQLKNRDQIILHISWGGTGTVLSLNFFSWLFFLCFCNSSRP